MWCWHKWPKWIITKKGQLEKRYDDFTGRMLEENERFITGRFVQQARTCEKCGKLQMRRVKV